MLVCCGLKVCGLELGRPEGRPRRVMPCCSGGSSRAPTHTSGPRCSTLGGRWPLLFHTLVLAGLSWLCACCCKFVGKGVVCCFNSVGGDDEVDVVQVGIQAFPGLQLLLCVLKGRVLARFLSYN